MVISRKTWCPYCNGTNWIRPLAHTRYMTTLQHLCLSCGYCRQTVVATNGRRGVAKDKLTDMDKKILGNVSFSR